MNCQQATIITAGKTVLSPPKTSGLLWVGCGGTTLIFNSSFCADKLIYLLEL